MVDRDLVIAKTATISRCLARVQHVTHGDPNQLDNIDAQDIFTLNLQRAVQAAVDLAGHLVATNNLGVPTSLKESFALLESLQLPRTLSKKLQSMVGFRNIAVHDYEALDVNILKKILVGHLTDLEEFSAFVLQHIEKPLR
jgi:uncharacterized protein YutE (UPF0331/DUF86 family)